MTPSFLKNARTYATAAVLAATPWLAIQFYHSTSQSECAPPSAPGFSVEMPKSEAPGLFPFVEHSRWLQPLSEDARLALTSGIAQAQESETGPELSMPAAQIPFTEKADVKEVLTKTPSGSVAGPSPAEVNKDDMALLPPSTMSSSTPAVSPHEGGETEYPVTSAPSEFAIPAVQAKIAPAPSLPEATEPPLLQKDNERLSAKPASEGEPAARSEQLERIARQADELTRHGYTLAGRGAYFAARSEFIQALRLVAQGLDAESNAANHGKALAAGLTALKEAEDFLPNGSRWEADLNVADTVACHSTPALKGTDLAAVSPITAMKSYLTFAQEQIASAVGHEVAGSSALRALGKLHDNLALRDGSDLNASGPKAVTFYQAALIVHPRNYVAANDLGVLFARGGNLEDAKAVLEHAARYSRQSTVWNNLASVYGRLGRVEEQRLAQTFAMRCRQAELARANFRSTDAGDRVVWMDGAAFAQNRSTPNRQTPPAPAGYGPAPNYGPSYQSQQPTAAEWNAQSANGRR